MCLSLASFKYICADRYLACFKTLATFANVSDVSGYTGIPHALLAMAKNRRHLDSFGPTVLLANFSLLSASTAHFTSAGFLAVLKALAVDPRARGTLLGTSHLPVSGLGSGDDASMGSSSMGSSSTCATARSASVCLCVILRAHFGAGSSWRVIHSGHGPGTHCHSHPSLLGTLQTRSERTARACCPIKHRNLLATVSLSVSV
jgi:hypothetical protein